MQSISVLIADNDPEQRLALRTLLTRIGHCVLAEAENGTQALTLTRSTRPDVVLVNLMLPVLSGTRVAQTLVGESLCPVVLFADVSQIEALTDVDACSDEMTSNVISCGAVGFLSLPFRETDLRTVLPIGVARFRERKALETEIKDLNERMEARKLVGRAKAILMERHSLSERDAFKRIQSQSTALGKPAHEIAQAIITASEIALVTEPVRMLGTERPLNGMSKML